MQLLQIPAPEAAHTLAHSADRFRLLTGLHPDHTLFQWLGEEATFGLWPQTGKEKLAWAFLAQVRDAPPYLLSAPCPGSGAGPCFNFLVLFGDVEALPALAEAIPLHPMFLSLLASTSDPPCLFAPFRNRTSPVEIDERSVAAFLRAMTDHAALSRLPQGDCGGF